MSAGNARRKYNRISPSENKEKRKTDFPATYKPPQKKKGTYHSTHKNSIVYIAKPKG
jgi:hypothetical protein